MQRKMLKIRKLLKLTFVTVLTFFVGTADEKCYLQVLIFLIGIPQSFEEK